MNGDEPVNGQGVVPLRTILTNFLNLVETYELRRNGGLDSYDSEFQELKQFSENLKSDHDHVSREGEKSVNRKKNRYKDILPYDYTRVILSEYGDVPGCDYINANYIKGASGSSAYIASQGPLPHTVNDFWRMVVECEVQVIVMACNEQESGKHKCENYWVEEDGVEREFGEVTVWLKKCRQVCPDFLVRTMRIRFTNSRGEKEERNVCQFHYSAWPDHGVPSKVRPLLDMVRLIRDRQTSETLPVLVHCSAGCGRTGTICAIDYVWGLLRLGRLTQDFSLFRLVREMRKQRIAMVQTKDQYILVHRAVKELFQEQLKIIDSHPYANVDENGLPLDLTKPEPTYETLDVIKCLKDPFLSCNNNDSNDGAIPAVDNNIVISVSNVNVGANMIKSSVPSKTAPPSSSSSSSAGVSNYTTPSLPHRGNNKSDSSSSSSTKFDKGKESVFKIENKSDSKDTQIEKSDREDREKEKKASSSGHGEHEQAKSSIQGLLRKPSIKNIKSFFEKNSKDDKSKKPGQLSRAKSDVSSRFYSFHNFSPFGSSSSSSQQASESVSKSDESKSTSVNNSSSANSNGFPVENSKEIKSLKKPPLFTKPTLPIKRSKSLKISPEKLTDGNQVKDMNNKTKKKLVGQNSNSGSVASSNPSTSSSTFSSNISDNPIKVCVKQVEIPKLQTIVSKSVKPEVQMATTQEYDYDIDDRSHLRQKPINPIDLQREAFQKSLTQIDKSECSGKLSEIFDRSLSINKKPIPPSRIHILKDKHNYANVSYENGRRKPVEMEDILVKASNHNSSSNYGKLKKCDTVNPRLLAATFGFTPKHERSSLTRSQSHVWQPDKTPVPIRIFSDENIHQSTTGEKKQGSSHAESIPIRMMDSAKKYSDYVRDEDDSKIFIQAIDPDISVKSMSSSDYKKNESGMNSSTENLLGAIPGGKPIIRRRVPKTNPYANYPACMAGSTNNSSNSSYKSSPTSKTADDNHISSNSSRNEILRGGPFIKDTVPLLKSGNGGSVGNSSDSSSNTGTPRNSLPSTPTQSVDVLYPQLYHRPGGNNSRSNPSQNNARIANGLPLLSQPKSILKDSLIGSTLESPAVVEDSSGKQDISRMFSNSPLPVNSSQQIPKINTIRIAVGVRERRNSFRQAVWKEAQPSGEQGNGSTGPSSGREQSNSNDIGKSPLATSSYSSNPFNSNSSSNGPLIPSEMAKSHRNYEPIWPDTTLNNHQSNYYPTSVPPYSMPPPTKDTKHDLDWRQQSAPHPGVNRFGYSGTKFEPVDSQKHNQISKTEEQVFQNKVDEIQVMLAELNAPAGVKSSDNALKQHRSLRAPSRSQYQQGISCFNFKKPSSFESVVEQLQLEEDQQALLNSSYSQTLGMDRRHKVDLSGLDSRNNITRGFHGRQANDYVTLRQCRTVDSPSGTGHELGNTVPSYTVSLGGSPEFHPKPGETSASETPVPPPRTKKNLQSAQNRCSRDFDSTSPEILEENSRHPFPAWASGGNSYHQRDRAGGGSNQNHAGGGGTLEINDNLSYDLSNSSDQSRNINTTSPKAIIKALASFQAKAANVRSRFANWTEAKDKSLSKRAYENGNGDLSEKESTPNMNSGFHPSPGPSVSTSSNHIAPGSLVRSKQQYL